MIITQFYDNLVLSARHVLKKWMQCRAWFRAKPLTCASLSGQADHSLTINCDLTVSCNCADIYGEGIIGDLNCSSLDEILSGEKARGFKRMLAQGRLPTINCATCPCLQPVKNPSRLFSFHLPRSLLLENTAACPLNCLSCKRRHVTALRKKMRLSLDDIERLAHYFRRIRLKKLYYYNQGEPFLSDTIKQELSIIRKLNPRITLITSTNGCAFDRPEKYEAALLFDHIYFSISGCDQMTLKKYQRSGNFDQSYHALKTLVHCRGLAARPVIEWKYLLFHWNDRPRHLKKAVDLAADAGADTLSFWKTPYPVFGISWRYYSGFSYFKQFGQESWKGREIHFKKNRRKFSAE